MALGDRTICRNPFGLPAHKIGTFFKHEALRDFVYLGFSKREKLSENRDLLVAIYSNLTKLMKRILSIIILLTVIISCSKEQHQKKENAGVDSLVIYSEDDFYKVKDVIIKIVDTACINATKRAQKDISRNKLTYFLIKGLSSRDVSNKEFKLLLKNYDIGFKNISGYCMRPPKGFEWNCYEKTINAEIEKRHGKNFIDSLRKVADIKFINSNPNFIFQWHECESTSRYNKVLDYNESLKIMREDLKKNLQLLNRNKKIEFGDTDISFIIHRDSSISNISITKDIKPNTPYNSKIVDSVIIDYMLKSKWNPGKFNGINVNSDWNIDI